MQQSYIGKYSTDTTRNLHDRQWGRNNEQDFIARIKGSEMETVPKLSTEVRKCVKIAVSECEMFGCPWSGIINGIQIQIHSIIK